jgi:lantibiotic transport system permease protein
MTASFVLNTRAELLKSKRTASVWLAVIGALFVPLVNFISLMARPDYFVKKLSTNTWETWINENWTIAGIFILPMFVILAASLLVQIEYRNNAWKQVYASPRSYADIFFSKLAVIHFFVLFCFLLFNVFVVMSAYMAIVFNSGYRSFLQPLPWYLLFTFFAKAYFSVLAITVIQYWLSLRFRNFIVPMGIGLALLVAGLVVHEWEKIYYYPYMYPAIIATREWGRKPDIVEQAKIWDLIWFAGVLGLCFWDTVRRKERG